MAQGVLNFYIFSFVLENIMYFTVVQFFVLHVSMRPGVNRVFFFKKPYSKYFKHTHLCHTFLIIVVAQKQPQTMY